MEEEDYDQYVLHFDQIDLDNYEYGNVRSIGGAYEVLLHPIDEEEDSCQMCLPSFKVGEEGIQFGSIENKRNVNISFNIDSENEEHAELAEWFEGFDDWVINSIIENHTKWFGSLWESGGKMEGKPRPPPEILAAMFERQFDGVSFNVRVPVRNNVPQIECFDIEHTTIPYNSIKNCDIIPIIEFKGIRLYSKRSCCDIVLRGVCAQCTYEDIGVDYKLCAEDDVSYNEDYGTEDEDESDDEFKNAQINQESPVEESPVEESPVEESPVEESPVEESPVEESPVEESPVEESPVEESPVEESPVEESPVEESPSVIQEPNLEIIDGEPTNESESVNVGNEKEKCTIKKNNIGDVDVQDLLNLEELPMNDNIPSVTIE